MNLVEPLFLWCVIAFGVRKHVMRFWRAGGWKRAVVVVVGVASGAGVAYLSDYRTPYYVGTFESETGYAFPSESRFIDRFASATWGCTIALVEIDPEDAKRLTAEIQGTPDFNPDTSTPDCGGVNSEDRGPYLAMARITSDDSWFWWGVSYDGQTLAFMRMDMEM